MALPTNRLEPPAYDSHTIFEPKSVNSATPPSYSLNASHSVAGATVPGRKLVIPTTSLALSSSFPYHASLTGLGIPPSEWATFTSELQEATAPTAGQKALAVLSGLGVACVTGCPWPAIYVGRWVLNRQVAGTVRHGLDEPLEAELCQKESVRAILKRWNAIWADKKVMVRLEVSVKGLNIDGISIAEEYEGVEVDCEDCQEKKSRCAKVACRSCQEKKNCRAQTIVRCAERRKHCSKTEAKGGCRKRERERKENCREKTNRQFMLVIETMENYAGEDVSEENQWANVREKSLGD